jgi:hypothetical protein
MRIKIKFLKHGKLLTFSIFFLFSIQVIAQKAPVDYVDVFVGTSNSRWMLGPYACVPFGMVQLGPDNQGNEWMGGYEYSISNVSAFSHIHAWTMAGLAVMPASQDLTTKDSPIDAAYRGAGATYHSRIDKKTEKAYPGYYSGNTGASPDAGCFEFNKPKWTCGATIQIPEFKEMSYTEIIETYEDDKSIQIYPNPVIDVMNVKCKGNINQIIIFNLLGETISRRSESPVNISGLKSGVYFVGIETDLKDSIKKIIKK